MYTYKHIMYILYNIFVFLVSLLVDRLLHINIDNNNLSPEVIKFNEHYSKYTFVCGIDKCMLCK